MKSRKFYFISSIVLGAAFLQSSITAQTPTPAPKIIAVETPSEKILKTGANLIHQGDLIDVDVIGSVEYDWRGTLNPEGFLNGIDFTENPIYALCRGEEKVAAEVAKAYAKILREPKVVVKILDRSNRPLSILSGAIKTPQRFQIRRPFFLNELLIVAGGLTERASGEIQIFRQPNLSCQAADKEESETTASGRENREKSVTTGKSDDLNRIKIQVSDLLSGKKEANPQILSGDIVTVLEAESIYVIGSVANPKQISARTQITLSRAVSSAGGTTKDADAKKITIYRREAGETKIIEADLEKVKTGAAEDLILQAFDIVEVAQTGRAQRKFSPVLKITAEVEKKTTNLPLRIID